MVPLASLLLLALAAPDGGAPVVVLERSVYAMGTRLAVEVQGASGVDLARATEAAFREVERIEGACSTWRADSSWSHLNRARGAAVPLDREWLDLLAAVAGWSRRTEGAFDPVLGALLRTWGVRSGFRTPAPDELARARAASGVALLLLDPDHGTARLANPDAAVDEGGFLKGYALDRMAQILASAGVHDALLDFGGQLLVLGRPRPALLADPEDRSRATLALDVPAGTSLSSSGTSEHGRHIVDPRTGMLCPAWGSVSVLASDGLTADVLSTALYVLGPEHGLAWADAHEVAAVFQRPGRSPVESRRAHALGVRPITPKEPTQ